MASTKKKKASKKSKGSSKRSKAKKPKARKSQYVPFKVLKARAARLNNIVAYREGKAKFA